MIDREKTYNIKSIQSSHRPGLKNEYYKSKSKRLTFKELYFIGFIFDR